MRRPCAPIVVGLVSIVAFAMAGCGVLMSPYENEEREGGVEASATVERLESIAGVTEARFTTVPWESPGEGGLFSSAGMDVVVELDIDPDVHLSDPAAAFEAIVEQAWATNEDFPKGIVVVVFDGGVSANFDWDEVVAADWGVESALSAWATGRLDDAGFDPTGRSVAAIADDDVAERFGDWPGMPPDDLDIELAPGAPEPVLIPAIEIVTLSIGSTSPRDCWTIRIDRAQDAEGEFAGSVELELLHDGESEGSATLTADGSTSSGEFCGYDHEEFDAADFTVVATPLDGGDGRFALTPVSGDGVEPRG